MSYKIDLIFSIKRRLLLNPIGVGSISRLHREKYFNIFIKDSKNSPSCEVFLLKEKCFKMYIDEKSFLTTKNIRKHSISGGKTYADVLLVYEEDTLDVIREIVESV